MVRPKTLRWIASTITVSTMLFALSTGVFADNPTGAKQDLSVLAGNIRHELVTLPYYSVFDNLKFEVRDDSTVVLSGQVVWAPLKDDADYAVKKVSGVEKVVNNIEILPLLPYDDVLRRKVFRAVYGKDWFYSDAIRPVPPIHIIVNNGNVTLEGIVKNENEKQVAELAANTVSDVLNVTNNLRVDPNNG